MQQPRYKIQLLLGVLIIKKYIISERFINFVFLFFFLEGLPVDKVKIKQAFLSLPMAEAFQNLFLDQNIEQG